MRTPLRAQVILHVARALRAGRIDIAFELAKNLRQRLADDVGQHVEPAAMRHARSRSRARCRSAARSSSLIQNRDGRFRAFQRETLLAHEARMQKMLELLGFDQVLAACARAFRDPAASCSPPAPCAAAASASPPDAGCSCTRIRSCRNRSGAASPEFRAAWPRASGRLRRSLRPSCR